jgi:hypothetical protein
MPGRFRSNTDRDFAYAVKTIPECVKQANDAMREHSLRNHSTKQAELAAFEIQAKKAIDPTGVPSTLYVSYLDYCREIWKKSNTYGGAVLENEIEAIIAKWKARKLDEAILRKPNMDLFAIKSWRRPGSKHSYVRCPAARSACR